MRSLLTILLFCLAPGSAAAGTDLVRLFAACTGRLSAEMEHAWLTGTDAAAITDRRAAMITLMEAVTPDEQARHALAVRIDAKMAHAALLTRATFNDDTTDANWARQRSEVEVAQCAALLLS